MIRCDYNRKVNKCYSKGKKSCAYEDWINMKYPEAFKVTSKQKPRNNRSFFLLWNESENKFRLLTYYCTEMVHFNHIRDTPHKFENVINRKKDNTYFDIELILKKILRNRKYFTEEQTFMAEEKLLCQL